MKPYGVYLKNLLERLEIKPAQLSDLTGIKKGTINSYVGQLRNPPLDVLKLIANTLRVPVGYFFGEMSLNEALYPDLFPTSKHNFVKHVPFKKESSLEPDDFIVIPYIDTIACAGTPFFSIQACESNTFYVMRKARFNDTEMCCFKMLNDSMQPFLHKGDILFVENFLRDNLADLNINQQEIYLCRAQDPESPDDKSNLVICRLNLFKRYLLLKTDNPLIDDITIELDERKFNPVIGRIIMSQRQI